MLRAHRAAPGKGEGLPRVDGERVRVSHGLGAQALDAPPPWASATSSASKPRAAAERGEEVVEHGIAGGASLAQTSKRKGLRRRGVLRRPSRQEISSSEHLWRGGGPPASPLARTRCSMRATQERPHSWANAPRALRAFAAQFARPENDLSEMQPRETKRKSPSASLFVEGCPGMCHGVLIRVNWRHARGPARAFASVLTVGPWQRPITR